MSHDSQLTPSPKKISDPLIPIQSPYLTASTSLTMQDPNQIQNNSLAMNTLVLPSANGTSTQHQPIQQHLQQLQQPQQPQQPQVKDKNQTMYRSDLYMRRSTQREMIFFTPKTGSSTTPVQGQCNIDEVASVQSNTSRYSLSGNPAPVPTASISQNGSVTLSSNNVHHNTAHLQQINGANSLVVSSTHPSSSYSSSTPALSANSSFSNKLPPELKMTPVAFDHSRVNSTGDPNIIFSDASSTIPNSPKNSHLQPSHNSSQPQQSQTTTSSSSSLLIQPLSPQLSHSMQPPNANANATSSPSIGLSTSNYPPASYTLSSHIPIKAKDTASEVTTSHYNQKIHDVLNSTGSKDTTLVVLQHQQNQLNHQHQQQQHDHNHNHNNHIHNNHHQRQQQQQQQQLRQQPSSQQSSAYQNQSHPLPLSPNSHDPYFHHASSSPNPNEPYDLENENDSDNVHDDELTYNTNTSQPQHKPLSFSHQNNSFVPLSFSQPKYQNEQLQPLSSNIEPLQIPSSTPSRSHTSSGNYPDLATLPPEWKEFLLNKVIALKDTQQPQACNQILQALHSFPPKSDISSSQIQLDNQDQIDFVSHRSPFQITPIAKPVQKDSISHLENENIHTTQNSHSSCEASKLTLETDHSTSSSSSLVQHHGSAILQSLATLTTRLSNHNPSSASNPLMHPAESHPLVTSSVSSNLDQLADMYPQKVTSNNVNPLYSSQQQLPQLQHSQISSQLSLPHQFTTFPEQDPTQIYPGSSKLYFGQSPTGVLVIKKPGEGPQLQALRDIANFLTARGVKVFVERNVHNTLEFSDLYPINEIDPGAGIDFGITLGGDGTVLHYNDIFNSNDNIIPPVVCFSMGTLGFLAPFPISLYQEVLTTTLSAHQEYVYCCTRTRLQCNIFRKGQFKASYANCLQDETNAHLRHMSRQRSEVENQPACLPTATPSTQQPLKKMNYNNNLGNSIIAKRMNRFGDQNNSNNDTPIPSPHPLSTPIIVPPSTPSSLLPSIEQSTPTIAPLLKPSLQSFYPLNEVVLQRSLSSMASIQLFVDGHYVTTISADGIIIATPTGSSGYCMAAGGPMVAPSTPALIITPICPHNLSFRPVVVCDGTLIRLRVDRTMDPTTPLVASFDGRNHIEMFPGDSIQVRVSKIQVPTIVFSEFNTDWFESIKYKLYWNARPEEFTSRKASH